MRKKYKCAFPHGRIKKIMQADEEVGKVAKAAPILVSKTLEIFVQCLIDHAASYTRAKLAKTITLQHIKAAILSDSRCDFLLDLVKDITLSSDIKIKKLRDENINHRALKSSLSAEKSAPSFRASRVKRKSKPPKFLDDRKGKTLENDEDEDEENDCDEDEEELSEASNTSKSALKSDRKKRGADSCSPLVKNNLLQDDLSQYAEIGRTILTSASGLLGNSKSDSCVHVRGEKEEEEEDDYD